MVTIRDDITGEMEHAKVSVYVEKDIPKYKGEAFTILFQASTFAIGRDISPSASKLLINLVGCVEYNNVISKGVNELAEHMGYSRRQIERAFKEFVITNPKHNLAGNAQYWYAETFRIRQLYTDAASAYLEGYQKYPKGEKAPIKNIIGLKE